MIIYNKSFWGLALFSRLYGSALPRTLPAALLAALLTSLLLISGDQARGWWIHPYPYQTFSFVVGFIIVFRSNYGYQRYWEARTQVQNMVAKWQESVLVAASFDRFTMPEHPKHDQVLHQQRFIRLLVHLVSLMMGVSCQALRRDPDLGNISVHNSKAPAPPLDPINLDRSMSLAVEQASIGTSSHWKDIFMLRASPRHLMKYNAAFPIPVIGHISLEELQAMACTARFPSSKGLFQQSLDQACCHRHLPYMERPYIVMAWLQQLLLERTREGGLAVPAPLLARVHTLLSEGLQGFEQARKIADTPFPFPWSQFILLLLVLHTVTVPVLMVAYVSAAWLAVVLSVISVVAYWAMNEVARDLEDPFLFEPNDIPLAKMQYDFNETLLHAAHCVRPASTIDHALRMRNKSYSVLGSCLEDMQLAVLSGLATTSMEGTPRHNMQGSRPASPASMLLNGYSHSNGHSGLLQRMHHPTLHSPFANQQHNRLEVVLSQGSYERLEEQEEGQQQEEQQQQQTADDKV